MKSCELTILLAILTTQATGEDAGGGEEGHPGQTGERRKGQNDVLLYFIFEFFFTCNSSKRKNHT